MAPSAAIIAAIGGDKAQREAAYEQLTALAHGDNAAVAAIISSASVHVSGIEGELEDEAKLADVFGQFGTVLMATLCVRRGGTAVSCSNGSPQVRVPERGAAQWALLTFGAAAEAQKAVDASLGAGLVVRAVDTQQELGSTGTMSDVMRQHQARVPVSVALTCLGPLVEAISTILDQAEFQRASCVLGELFMLDPPLLSVEYIRSERYAIVWKTPGNAYNAVRPAPVPSPVHVFFSCSDLLCSLLRCS